MRVKKGASRKCDIESDPRGINIQAFISKVDPLLWEFITECTLSIHSKYHHESSHVAHLKDVRRYFILCVMQYCANIEQPLAIHNVLADVVHTCGGSCASHIKSTGLYYISRYTQ